MARPKFWLGLLYITFFYQWLGNVLNDAADIDIDECSSKRDARTWRVTLDRVGLRRVLVSASWAQVPWVLWLSWTAGIVPALGWIAAFMIANALYDGTNGFFAVKNPRFVVSAWSRRPLLDLVCNLAFYAALPWYFANIVLDVQLSWAWMAFYSMAIVQLQLVCSVADLETDMRHGKFMTASLFGRAWTVRLAFGMLFLIALWTASVLHQPLPALAFAAFGLAGLLRWVHYLLALPVVMLICMWMLMAAIPVLPMTVLMALWGAAFIVFMVWCSRSRWHELFLLPKPTNDALKQAQYLVPAQRNSSS